MNENEVLVKVDSSSSIIEDNVEGQPESSLEKFCFSWKSFRLFDVPFWK